MKLSQLKNIIKESIKQLTTEQSVGYTKWNVRSCTGGSTYGALCLPNSSNAQIGDVVTYPTAPPNGNPRNYFIRDNRGPCTETLYNFQNQPFITSPQNCPNCCQQYQWQSYAFQFGGSCTFNCGTTTAGSCNPQAWPQYNNWTNTFTNTVNNLIQQGNPNQPCQFLNNKIAQWTNSLSGGGSGGAANLWQCKLDHATQLHSQNNC